MKLQLLNRRRWIGADGVPIYTLSKAQEDEYIDIWSPLLQDRPWRPVFRGKYWCRSSGHIQNKGFHLREVTSWLFRVKDGLILRAVRSLPKLAGDSRWPATVGHP
ncbi:predicted protein [Coccidioides posadasii str. Silveira]|uniref:Predicted protein n=1 Tax=Coccidioides posadasii (strain RMSCC 757 / Silveira) TaxID=443226 RepID=E9D2G2_COCPS|nr:predicted protein [Coccidioides posadasii str. Silveira]